MLLVRKKDGSLRFCVDFRLVNSKTKKDWYPVPRIDTRLEIVSPGRYFTTLDCTAAYWSIPIHPDDREKTSFNSPIGSFQFRQMHFGLCNSGATFSRFMGYVLSGFEYTSCLSYIDDLVIFSPTLENHASTLDKILHRISDSGLTLRGLPLIMKRD